MEITRIVQIAAVCLCCLPGLAGLDSTGPQPRNERIKVLVLSGGGYHDFQRNTDALIAGLQQHERDAFDFDLWMHSEADVSDQRVDLSDPEVFERYAVIVAYTQGDLGAFTEDVRKRFLRFIQSGGGYVAIHSAADSHPGWDAYDKMLGGRFESHPPVGEFTVQVEVADHPITRGLPATWTLTDEFYHLRGVDEQDMLVLMRGRSPGDDDDAPLRPVAWERSYGTGRVFYTILGHDIRTHSNQQFHELIARAITWAADAPKQVDEQSDHRGSDEPSKEGPMHRDSPPGR